MAATGTTVTLFYEQIMTVLNFHSMKCPLDTNATANVTRIIQI